MVWPMLCVRCLIRVVWSVLLGVRCVDVFVWLKQVFEIVIQNCVLLAVFFIF